MEFTSAKDTAPIKTYESEEELDLGKSRIRNMGNTCYMNSILQCINHTPLLREYILSNRYVDDLKYNISTKAKENDEILDENQVKTLFKTNIIYQLHRIMKIMWSKNCLVTPASFRKLIAKKNDMFNGFRQHDSQEFMIYIIDQIHEEMAKKTNIIFGNKVYPKEEIIKNKLNDIKFEEIQTNLEHKLISMLANVTWRNYIRNQYSIVTELFTGLFHSTLESQVCHNKSHAFDPFMCLSASIPINTKGNTYLEMKKEFSLYEVLDNFFSSEVMTGDNKVNCERCCKKTSSTKQISIWFPPKILIIQIKRFLKNPYGFTTRKINNSINYPIRGLDLYNYTSDANKKSYKYNLFAVNIHSDFGGIHSGHYYSYCKNTFDNKWYCYNDENIREIDNVQHKDAYLLFYYLVN
jgi:ubiquitin C-terminal hydrolase